MEEKRMQTNDTPYIAIYRRFRPEIFDKVIGQAHVVNVLKAQIASGSVPHAYLFSGTRGTGKTTMARLLAKGLNCLSDAERPCGVCENCRAIAEGGFVDVIEIDAASNNGVADVREIKDIVIYPPTSGKYRVFIIDEAHMLTQAASNAFLKTLEEPPENTVFILATTEPGKLPATIRSRCLSFEFKRLPQALIKEGLAGIAERLGIEAEGIALSLIATESDGSFRDALSVLEQCLPPGRVNLTREDVLEAVGSAGDDAFAELSEAVEAGDTAAALLKLAALIASGKEVRRIMEDWIDYYRSALLIKYIEKPETLLARAPENIDEIRKRTGNISESRLSASIVKLSKLYNESRWLSHPGILLEMLIIELSEEAR
jgi:DNA polymerase-3 subunit gamma/tau